MKKILLIGLAVTTLLYGCDEENTSLVSNKHEERCDIKYDRISYNLLLETIKEFNKEFKKDEPDSEKIGDYLLMVYDLQSDIEDYSYEYTIKDTKDEFVMSVLDEMIIGFEGALSFMDYPRTKSVKESIKEKSEELDYLVQLGEETRNLTECKRQKF